MIDDSTVANACGVFAWRAVFDCADKNFNWVFAGAEIDNFESLFDDVSRFGFFAAVLAWAHHVVYEALNNVDVGFAESLVFVAAHAVGCDHWGQV